MVAGSNPFAPTHEAFRNNELRRALFEQLYQQWAVWGCASLRREIQNRESPADLDRRG